MKYVALLVALMTAAITLFVLLFQNSNITLMTVAIVLISVLGAVGAYLILERCVIRVGE